MRKFSYLIVLIVAILASPSLAEYTAIDGDSLRHGKERIRLLGIDAPEASQTCRDADENDYECGQNAFEYINFLIKDGKDVDCQCQKKRDRYKRKLCECFVNGKSINAQMVEAGWAITYLSDKYAEEEALAKAKMLGVWKGRFIKPSIYRAIQREQKKKDKIKKSVFGKN